MTQTDGRDGKPLAPGRRSQEFALTEYDAWQERQRRRNWTLGEVPFYKGKGQSLEQNPFDWHNYDYLNYYDQVYGRKCGSAGIGRLREVALTTVSSDDDYANHPYMKEDPDYIVRDGLLTQRRFDIGKLREQQLAYAATLEQNGIKVYWLDYPEKPMAAYGPMTNQHSTSELTILPGGSIIPKKGYALAPLSGFGRTEYLARWAFWNLSIPVLLTITGKGVWIQGIFLCDDVYVHAISVETNEDGMQQFLPVLRRQCGENVHVQRIYTPGCGYFDHKSGISAHTDMIIAPVDIDKVVAYPASLDVDTCNFLWSNGWKIIEAPLEEQVNASACNLVTIEPGLVVMHRGAKETIKAVRKAGVEVIEVDYDEYNRFGGGIHCATMQILRDPGPRKFS